ncbi:DEAD/DEAH box helicase [Pseudomonas sp. GD04087]|uniref:DEAD/DEAH box helicase n=1 Tax=unclassified Pseudomonas TaxID=196821 RepID=UPI00244744BE|nr:MULTISPECIES: DEAD/DEAH box helicase [unclassified Pseudomonas]MDH0287645.1 DEAD/DEAH box helicase [Pseudomonas sp. GD04087]MDH1050929.1 DEAD/DEAH box helicase [Pseudomonas sp. GD03903]MDH2003245.1 DEAD/DEAH box helicase [Pseudomonas sp. GD03691]
MTAPRTSSRAKRADVLSAFHPAVAAWFRTHFSAPTQAQVEAWPAIQAGESTLVAAPTGSGKTLTAFLSAIDALVREGLANGGALPDRTTVIYVSPLKALSNDIRINLEEPLAGIRATLVEMGLPEVDIRTAVRTGDSTSKEREAMRKRVPHILVTTPESLYVLLGSDSGRAMLAGARSVIVDEIHALAASKRGSHLALSLERLQALCEAPLVRIGLSATQKPIEAVAAFLVGRHPACRIVDIGYSRRRDLNLEVPTAPLEAVMSHDVWDKVYDRLAELAGEHRTTLVFVNTRRLSERITRHLAERIGAGWVAAHHGSLSKELRLGAERRLKAGQLKVLVATASLELGIDIGDVELVCQIGSPRSIAAFLQRVGRSGHSVGGTPKGRLFPTSRDDLVECVALLDSVRQNELDALSIPHAPLDVLAQQMVAEVACQEWREDALFELFTAAQPYADLSREQFDALLRTLAEGYSSRNGQRGAYLHRDAVHQRLRGRRGAKLTAVTSGGTIPDTGDYAVLLEPQGLTVGTVNEDFAVESLAGDVFQLGNISYRILRVEPGRVRVEDAQGQPPNIPFWLGEAPGRSDELSTSVARLRGQLDELLARGENDPEPLARAIDWLRGLLGLDDAAARQLVEYLARARHALGALPTQKTLILERFFDESDGMQLVIHSPYGSRLNRAWGLALRKRFCRTFNFELQAAATEDAIILSLSTSHSFPLDEVWRYLHSNSAEQVLIQALLDAPLFGVRWRWNATTALALPRYSGGRKVAPQLQRMRSEDLLASVFPDQVACLENIVGEREIPDHPLVAQTLDDCLHEAMDSQGWLALLRRMERGEVSLLARDLPAPSPLAAEVLSASPYAFLDDAPLEERRTQAVQSRRWTDPESADDLGALDAEAIDAVRAEAWPEARDADEMHEALSGLGGIRDSEAQANEGWPLLLKSLAKAGRATRLALPVGDVWVAAERLSQWLALHPQVAMKPVLELPPSLLQPCPIDEAQVELVRARLTGFGPRLLCELATDLGISTADAGVALASLEREGYVLRGRFTPGGQEQEWCERHLLARIHRYTVKRLRREIEPVQRADFMRFLFDWQRVSTGTRVRGAESLAGVLSQLEGFQAAASAWENDILPSRVADYGINWLDDLCRAGRIVWARLPGRSPGKARGGPLKSTPIVLLPRAQMAHWSALSVAPVESELSAKANKVLDVLKEQGASFFEELASDSHLLRTELETVLGELVAAGRVNADSFAGLRALLMPAARRHPQRRSRTPLFGMADAGRWALLRRSTLEPGARLPAEVLEHVAMTLLRRYGVVCWRLLDREADWLPPWRDLLRVYHRLEARGEIRGGRFVAGLTGEQFALPEAVGLLREVRRREANGEWLVVCAVDPLNLAGTLLPGRKVPAVSGNRVLYRDGVPVGALIASEVEWLAELAPEDQARARELLIRR